MAGVASLVSFQVCLEAAALPAVEAAALPAVEAAFQVAVAVAVAELT